MKKCSIVLAIIAMTVLFVFGITACSSGGAGGSGGNKGGGGKTPAASSTFKGTDLAGNKYTLKVSSARSVEAGSDYELIIESADGKTLTTSGDVEKVLDNQLMLSTDEGGEFDVILSGSNISAIVGEITLADGSVFIVRTFASIPLRASRWEGLYGKGENWTSGDSIKLIDILKGDITNILNPQNELSYLKFSGNVDVKLEHFTVALHYVMDDGWDKSKFGDFKWLHLGGSGVGMDLPTNEVPKGEFSVTTPIKYNTFDGFLNSELPPGEVYLAINEELYSEHYTWAPHSFDHGRIPSDIPDYAVMAIIKNLTIELVAE